MTSSRWALRPPPAGPAPKECPAPRSGPPLRSRLSSGPAPRAATLANSTGYSSGARGRRPEKPELGEPSGPRPPSSHGGGRAAAPGAALRAVGALRAAGGPTGQPPRPRPGKDPTGKLRRATIGERGQGLAHPKSVPEGPPQPLPLPGASPGAAAPGADSAPDVRPGPAASDLPGTQNSGCLPSSVVGSGCHWCTPWGGGPPEPCRRLPGRGRRHPSGASPRGPLLGCSHGLEHSHRDDVKTCGRDKRGLLHRALLATRGVI